MGVAGFGANRGFLQTKYYSDCFWAPSFLKIFFVFFCSFKLFTDQFFLNSFYCQLVDTSRTFYHLCLNLMDSLALRQFLQTFYMFLHNFCTVSLVNTLISSFCLSTYSSVSAETSLITLLVTDMLVIIADLCFNNGLFGFGITIFKFYL